MLVRAAGSTTATDFFVDPDGTVAILLTQVELGDRSWPLLEGFQALHSSSR